MTLPLRVLVPDHAPDALQDVALVELQVKVVVVPRPAVVGLADNTTVGAVAACPTAASMLSEMIAVAIVEKQMSFFIFALFNRVNERDFYRWHVSRVFLLTLPFQTR